MTSRNSTEYYTSDDDDEVDILPTTQSVPTTDSSFFRPSVLTPFTKPTVSNSNGVEESSSKTPATTDTHLNLPATKSGDNATTKPVLSPKDIFNPPPPPATGSEVALSDYVFGANISSRVTNAEVTSGASSNLWTKATGSNPASSSCSKTAEEAVSSDSVFTTLAKAITKPKASEETSINLLDSAAIRLEQTNKEVSVRLEHVPLVTGEEDETQVFRSHCRAHVFDTGKQKWNAIGAADFHLNDLPLMDASSDRSGIRGSRIVVRLASTGRLIVNSLVWKDMPMALVDARSLRIAAVHENDDQAEVDRKTLIKNYLFIFPADDSVDRLFSQLQERKKLAETSACTISPTTGVALKRTLDKTEENLATKIARCESVKVNALKGCSSKPVASSQSTCVSTEAASRHTQVEKSTTDSKSEVAVEGQANCESRGAGNKSEGDYLLPSEESVKSSIISPTESDHKDVESH